VNKRRLAGLLGPCRGRRGSLVGGLGVLGLLCGLVMAVGASSALAATPEAPEVSVVAGALPGTEVTFGGVLNPSAAGEAGTYEFLYKASETGECEGGVKTSPGMSFGGEREAVPSEAVTGLTPGTEYAVCLRAENTSGGAAVSAPESFTTATHPTIAVEESATDVGSTSATLNASIDPGGALTTYRFEYLEEGSGAGYALVPGGEGSIGSGTIGVAVKVQWQGLSSSKQYRYRVKATNSVGTVTGEGQAFTTQPGGEETSLIDNRAWELVTPPDKHAATLRTSESSEGGIVEASNAGDAITYLTTAPTGTEAEGNRPLEAVQNVATRTPSGGWETRDITTANETVGAWQFGNNAEYKVFSEDLSSAVLEPAGTTPLSPSQEGRDEQTLYFREGLGSGGFTPLVTAANAPGGAISAGDTRYLKFEGASPDLKHVVFYSELNGSEALYEWNKGEPEQSSLQPVSVLPESAPTNGATTAGELGSMLGNAEEGSEGLGGARNAVSIDGSLVVWGSKLGAVGSPIKDMYVRDMKTHETVQLDVPQAGSSGLGAPSASFQGASGSAFVPGASGPPRIYFLDKEALTPKSYASIEVNEGTEENLYVAELHMAPLSVSVTDLSPVSKAESPNVLGNILGYGESDAGAYVYYVADGALEPGAGSGNCYGEEVVDTCSLYEEQYENAIGSWRAPRLIATLSGVDKSDWGGFDVLERQTARVSSSGQYLTFMSELPLTGYDNRDAHSGQRDAEVFLYDADTDGLRCISCNPTGARPDGTHEGPAATSPERPRFDPTELYAGKWLAASLPGWATAKAQEAIYQPRYLSNSGRVYFDSPDALVPQDIDGTEDVYEYEPEGAEGGRCDESTHSATEVYVRSTEARSGGEAGVAGGCLGLISSGRSRQESAFLDASENGQDVFFVTSAQLAPQDIDSAYDIYDAHVCSESAPCPAGAESVPPACTDTDSCRAAPVPQPAIFGLPTSATFNGSGNPKPVPAATVKAKPLTRAQKLEGALKACTKKPKKRRAACRAQAQKRYGAKTKVKKSTRRGK
jgi:hypothetical protein